MSAREISQQLYCCRLKTFTVMSAFVLVTSAALFASEQEDRAADAVAAAFVEARGCGTPF